MTHPRIFRGKLGSVAFFPSDHKRINNIGYRTSNPSHSHHKSNMMCKGSQALLAKGSSVSSLKSLSSSSSVSETGGRKLGQGLSRMQRSSSSLSLLGSSFESSADLRSSYSNDSLSSQRYSTHKLKSTGSAHESQEQGVPTTFNEVGGAKLAQCVLFLALAMQLL